MDIGRYKYDVQHNLDAPHCGCIDYHFENIFEDVLERTDAQSILEFGFNAGSSALLFLMLRPSLLYTSLDIVRAPKSVAFLHKQYNFAFLLHNSNTFVSPMQYDLVFIDGDHAEESVRKDIESALTAKPKWILFDDVLHPGHSYIWTLINEDERLEVEELYEMNDLWEGCSMALCKVK